MPVATWGGNIQQFQQLGSNIQPFANGSGLVIPYTFVPGTVADANEVNANFAAVSTWVSQNGGIVINQPLTFNVAPNGNDAGNYGTQPFATVTQAYNVLRALYRYGVTQPQVTIQLAPGTYNETVWIGGVIPGQGGNPALWIQGNQSNPSSVVINGDPAITANDNAQVTVAGVTLTSPNLHGLSAAHGGQLAFTNCNFGNCGLSHLYANRHGRTIAGGNYSVSGNALVHAFANEGGNVTLQVGNVNNPAVNPGPQVTINGTPAFSLAFAAAQDTGLCYFRFVGFINGQNVIGPQYFVTANAVVDAGGATLPGNAPGSADNGGVFKP